MFLILGAIRRIMAKARKKKQESLMEAVQKELLDKLKQGDFRRSFVEEIRKKIEGAYAEIDKMYKALKLKEGELGRIYHRIEEMAKKVGYIEKEIVQLPKNIDLRNHILEIKSDFAKEINHIKADLHKIESSSEIHEIKQEMAALQNKVNKELAEVKVRMMEIIQQRR